MSPHHADHTVTPMPARAPLATTQGTLALDLAPSLDPPRPRQAPVVEPGSPPEGTPTEGHGVGHGVGHSVGHGAVVPIDQVVRRHLEAWSRRYVQAVVEIITGDRPASQLVRWTTPRVHDELVRRAQVVARAGVHRAGLGRGRRPVVRPSVASVHSCFLGPGVAEVAVTVDHGARTRAVAARFEHRDGRWLCCALEFG